MEPSAVIRAGVGRDFTAGEEFAGWGVCFRQALHDENRTPRSINAIGCTLLFIITTIVLGLFLIFGNRRGIDVLPRHPVLLAGPLIEIDQLAALRTERPPRFVPPLGRLSAGGTIMHTAKLRRN